MNRTLPKSTRDPEELQDEKLRIRTAGRIDSQEDDNHYPYEPTSYAVLQRAAESGLIGNKNHLVDYGSGKGRAAFFLHDLSGCSVTGVEFDKDLHTASLENLETYAGDREGICFVLGDAERFAVPHDADLFWFFNPFSVKVLRAVTARIMESWYDAPRRMLLFFYYPSDEMVSFLMTLDGLTFYDEIDCRDLFPGNNPRERILIVEMEA